MYGPKTDEADAARMAELRYWGLSEDDFGTDADDGTQLGVWPENMTAVRVFDAMSTQWRASNGRPIGLDYAALPVVLRLLEVPRAAHADTFDCLRTLEDEAMKVLRESVRG